MKYTPEEIAELLKERPNQPHYIAALVKRAVKEEREACAKVCESLGVHPALNVFNGGPEWYKHGKNCAAAIRARGQENKS